MNSGKDVIADAADETAYRRVLLVWGLKGATPHLLQRLMEAGIQNLAQQPKLRSLGHRSETTCMRRKSTERLTSSSSSSAFARQALQIFKREVLRLDVMSITP